MSDLFAPFVADPGSAGLFLDFDGTLSDIVHVPDEARPLEGVTDLLTLLSARLNVVAIVSGRSAGQLLEWLGPEVEIWGVHGVQRAIDGQVTTSSRASEFVPLMNNVREEAAILVEALGMDGVVLEDKGVMVGLHFRAAEDVKAAEAALRAVADDLVERYGLTRAGGRLAFELRPPMEISKSLVVLERAREAHLRSVAFVGDDRVDLPGFDALDQLHDEGMHTVRVAVDSSEAPAELLERADIVVDGPRGLLPLLRRLID
ncbi:MAG TPA: trehalose-phosphatase [Actinomycetota bacterium]|nr:trehalose-phosphatase [Actinomycetota bacterium]